MAGEQVGHGHAFRLPGTGQDHLNDTNLALRHASLEFGARAPGLVWFARSKARMRCGLAETIGAVTFIDQLTPSLLPL